MSKIEIRDIIEKVANSIQTVVFFEYLVTSSIPMYIFFIALFSILDVSNIDYYFGLIALLIYQYVCCGITYRVGSDDYPRLCGLLKTFFVLVVLGEIGLISYMLYTFVKVVNLYYTILILMLVKDVIFILFGMIGYWFLKNHVYINCENALDYHKDAMRLLAKHGSAKYKWNYVSGFM